MENTIERYAQFGNKFIQYQQLLRGNLSLKTASKKRSPGGWTVTPISHELKNIFLDLLTEDKFDEKKYEALAPGEQELFDRACQYANVQSLAVNRALRSSDRNRQELLRRYEVLKGELLAGSDSREILKKMRNLLIEMYSKNYIPASKYNRLISEIVTCL